MNAFLTTHSLSKRFGTRTVLRDVDFEVNRGECLVLLGPSGCGKTTLLNILAGMLNADAGELHCDGVAMDCPARGLHQPMRERRFSMVFQDFALWPHMTVGDNVAFGLRIRGVAGGERQRRVADALEQVRMLEHASRKPAELSGGQQQRVSIARALVVRPRLLLMDEPLSALDARLREDLKSELAALLKATGITAVYVTHDQSEAFTLGTRIALMHEGLIAQIGSPEAVYSQPATTFVAGFLGVSNLISFRRENGALLLGDAAAVPWPHAATPPSGQLMLRREAVSVSTGQMSGDGAIVLSGTCHRVNYLGDRREAVVRVGDELLLKGFACDSVREGATVSACFSRDAVRFLPT